MDKMDCEEDDPSIATDAADPKPIPMVANRISFANVATLMDKILKAPAKDRPERLKAYLGHMRSNFKKAHGTLDPAKANNDSLYSIIRIFLPTEDRGRGPYNIRGPTLGKIFARILGLDGESEDGKKLIDYKNPEKSGFSAGSLPDIIFSILERRSSSSKRAPNLAELHEVLDSIVKNDNHKSVHAPAPKSDEKKVNIEVQVRILRNFIRELTPLEGKWLANILLKHVTFGLTKKQIFKCLHPQAQQLYDKMRNLEQVCIQLNDPDATVNLRDSGIQMFQPFKPMLSSRLLNIKDNDSDDVEVEATSLKNQKKDNNKVADCSKLPAPPFYIEIKWDGERFQIHYDSSKHANDRFRYFSRNSFDCTLSFNQTLTPRLKPQIKGGCDSFILDGEMMAWRYSTRSFTQKGANIDVKRMKIDNPNHCPAFVAYDLVHFNGKDLTGKPLKDRMEILNVKKLVIIPLEGVVVLSEQKVVHSAEQVNQALDNAVSESDEGLMVKAMHSTYDIGQRGAAWLKVKPEYFDSNSVDDLDLIILGGYYTESTRKSGAINHFLVGLLDNSSPGKEGFYPLARIQSRRLKDPEMEALVKQLSSQLIKKENPAFNIHFRGRKRPDLFINPKNSIVVQVKASEIIYNAGSALQYTLRFPRITAVRQDKSWDDIMTVKEFHALRINYGGKLACRSDGQSPIRQKPASNFGKVLNTGKGPNLSFRATTARPQQKTPGRQTENEEETLTVNQATSAHVSPKHLNLNNPTSLRTRSWKNKGIISPLSSKQKPDEKITRDIFASRIFLVNGFADWKSKTEARIKEFGGCIVQNPVPKLFAIVADILSIKVKNFMQSGKYDIVKLDWIEKCISEGKIEKMQPEHLWFAGPETEKVLRQDFDCYGDSYTKPLSSIEMKLMLEAVMKTMDEESKTNPTSKINPVESESEIFEEFEFESEGTTVTSNFDSQDSCRSVGSYSFKPIVKRVIEKEIEDEEDRVKLRKYNFLDGCKIAFRESAEDNLKNSSTGIDPTKIFQLSIQIEFHGGQVATDEEDVDTTHVVVFDPASPAKKEHLSAHVVKGKWLLDCLEKKKIVEELFYMAK